MFYSYNAMAGRLIRTTYLRAYRPQGLSTLRAPDPVNPYSISVTHVKPAEVAAAPVAVSKGFASQAASESTAVKHLRSILRPDGYEFAPVPDHIKKLQQLCQKDDSVPIHLKRGLIDKMFLYATFALIYSGLAMSAYYMYDWIFPPKPAEE